MPWSVISELADAEGVLAELGQPSSSAHDLRASFVGFGESTSG